LLRHPDEKRIINIKGFVYEWCECRSSD